MLPADRRSAGTIPISSADTTDAAVANASSRAPTDDASTIGYSTKGTSSLRKSTIQPVSSSAEAPASSEITRLSVSS